jgi:hypothetical protein
MFKQRTGQMPALVDKGRILIDDEGENYAISGHKRTLGNINSIINL